NAPATPVRTPAKRVPATTPRIKKKVPWKGKNIMVLIPRDDERGRPGQAPAPLNTAAVNSMLRSWEQLGYAIDGFDLNQSNDGRGIGAYSQSRASWPDDGDLARERANRTFRVQLPDLNAWKQYVDELNEAKLRALGVSFGDDDPPPPSISPASTMSRQPSVTHYPPLPFSPPIPTSSASSNQVQGFPFQFGTSGTMSPGIPSTASPVPFPGKFNPRASISIPSPHAWSPQMMLHQGMHRGGSPSLANFSALMSPTSPFSPDGMSGQLGHQRHQSLQYPMLQHQFQPAARASPRLQDLREVDEEAPSKSPSKTPEPANFVKHNASDSLQQEIDEAQTHLEEMDEAQYHLEEQMRSQLDNDQDYSPHNEAEQAEAAPVAEPAPKAAHTREPSVTFAPQAPRFGVAADGVTLHHPRPHSRGHSLSQKYFTEEDASKQNPFSQGSGFPRDLADVPDEAEIETNPSNLGTPIQALDFSKLLHQRSFSTASNPWTDNESGKSASGRRLSHGSKPSLSGLNVDAPEFKFNPESTFKPGGQFMFGGTSSFQPAAFNAGLPSASSSQFSLPTTNSSKINANAPAFSPGQSDFSFSAAVPKFRPDAPAFNPFSHSVSNSVTSPLSGGESGSNRASSIFGNIDLSSAEFVKPVKKSKAIPIVRPASRESPAEQDQMQEGPDGRLVDESRVKRARGNGGDDDDVPRFADPNEEATPVPESRPKEADESDKEEEEAVQSEDKSFEEDNMGPADTTFSSTMVSETTDTKATGSPVTTSPDQAAIPWAPFEFNSNLDVASFNDARPFGEDTFKRGHKNSLSATANAFVPGATLWGTSTEDAANESAGEAVDALDAELVDEDAHADLVDESFDEGEIREPLEEAIKEAMDEPIQQPVESIEDAVEFEAPAPAPVTLPKGLSGSRFAAPPSSTVSTPKGLTASRFATSSPPPPPKHAGLSASRFAASPSPVHEDEVEALQPIVSPLDAEDYTQQSLPLPTDSLPPVSPNANADDDEAKEQSMAELDAIMLHLSQNPSMGVIRAMDHQPQFEEQPQFDQEPQYHHPSPTRHIDLAAVTNSSPLHLPPQQHIFRSDAPSPSPGRHRPLPGEVPEPMLSTELEDPFVDPPQSAMSLGGPAHPDGTESPASDWEAAFTEDEHTKLESRVNFFDGHVNGLVGNLLDARIAPLEDTMDDIKHLLASMNRRTPSSRRDRRSISAEIQHSDADDEDEELPVRRSMSPRRDKRMEQIRAVFLDVLAQQQHLQPAPAPVPVAADNSGILKALEEMKEQFGQSLHLDFRGEDLRNIVEDAVERRMPATPQPIAADKTDELHARILDLEQRLHVSEAKIETEAAIKRAAEDRAAELARQLETAETRIEVEIMNKSAFDQRVADLDDRLHHQEEMTKEELQGRRDAEDRLSEIQRLLRISSEEETRLRELVEEKDHKIKSLESSHGKSTMRLALLEAGHNNSQQSQSESQNRINILESDLRDARQEARHYRSEAERLTEFTRRNDGDLSQARDENKSLHKLIDTLGVQLEENERMREAWRSKFITLQNEMSQAAREITEENQQRTKKEQALMARQEVLDARLQAEALTRERIEAELERLEGGERQGMRAVSECKRLEALIGELRTENHQLHQTSLRYQAEFQEARESAAREVQRTRDSMQAEIDDANHQVNIAREELEDQMSRLRAQLDQVKLDADTAKARHDMLLEESQSSKRAELEELARKHQNDLEDTQASYERQINNTTEDAQRAERNLLERLSISNSKSEYLHDKVAHLEEKLEIAKEAARAAAQAARSTVTSPEPASAPAAPQAAHVAMTMQLPEKISPQALRESIMVLQEQLQDREQKIEELEVALGKLDPDAETKISKRDDEIIWLRELLAVRHSDLQDIIAALGRDDYDRTRVKDAAIRLKANLQMEEQERERAMNGGSAVNLPNIAASLRDATPRVAQAVGPLAAAWGNWRKGRDPNSFGSISGVLSPGQASDNNSTPSKSSPSQSSFLGGLLTPPASGLRQTPPGSSSHQTAFSATGRRFTAQDLANRPKAPTTRAAGKMPMRGSPSRPGPGPMTPPMMRSASYDADAQVEDFDDAGFFDD
ncbi:hypothetical protein GQ53DRAFT_602778, partial [Thozetella sp. PMI_491]